MQKKVLIVGLGYVGLTLSAVLLKRTLFKVYGLDADKTKILSLKKGRSYIFEPNLELIINRAIKNKRFHFGTNLIGKFDIIIICVGTPVDNNKNIIDDYLVQACEEVKNCIKSDSLVILRSTVKIGSTRKIVKKIIDKANIKYYLCFCPERTSEGDAINELEKLPQIIAADNKTAILKAKNFFKSYNNYQIYLDKFEKGELIKLIDNCYRDTFFSMSNQIALMADELNFDSDEIIEKANYKFSRTNLAKAGPVGGPCLSKDPYILYKSFRFNKPEIFLQGRKVNERFILNRIDSVIKIIKKINKKNIKLSIVGITFKNDPQTNDTRYSSAIKLIESLKKYNSKISISVLDRSLTKLEIQELGCTKIENLYNVFKNKDIAIFHSQNKKDQKKDLFQYYKINKNIKIYSFWNFPNVKKLIDDNKIINY
jgi:nucleotide sugar dehydrogenase